MTAEAHPEQQPSPAETAEADHQHDFSPTSEQGDKPPILVHFYGYCETNGLDAASTDLEDGPRLASGIHDYLSQAIARRINESDTVPRDQRPSIALAKPERIERCLAEFYRDYGPTEPRDRVLREHRNARLQQGIGAAWEHHDTYPEIGLTSLLEEHLSDAGHYVAASSALILLAATGESFRRLRT